MLIVVELVVKFVKKIIIGGMRNIRLNERICYHLDIPRCRCVVYFYNKNNPEEIPDSLTNPKQIQKELRELNEIAFNIDAGELPKSYMPDVMDRIRYFRNKR